jgi:hypothetical protein
MLDDQEALRNAHVYHYRGSFFHGLALIRDAAGKENNRRREAVREKRKSYSEQTKQAAKNAEANTTAE